MSERARYIALAIAYRDTASQFSKILNEEIALQVSRGIEIDDSIRSLARTLGEGPRLLEAAIRDAKRGGPVDVVALRKSHDSYLATIQKIQKAIEASLRVN